MGEIDNNGEREMIHSKEEELYFCGNVEIGLQNNEEGESNEHDDYYDSLRRRESKLSFKPHKKEGGVEAELHWDNYMYDIVDNMNDNVSYDNASNNSKLSHHSNNDSAFESEDMSYKKEQVICFALAKNNLGKRRSDIPASPQSIIEDYLEVMDSDELLEKPTKESVENLG